MAATVPSASSQIASLFVQTSGLGLVVGWTDTVMLEARPKGFFSRDFQIEDGGREIAMLDVSGWKEAGEVAIDGRPYRLYREGLTHGAFVLESDGAVVARAVKPSAWRSRFELELEGGRPATLQKASLFGRGFSVVQEGMEVGAIRPTGPFTRRTILDLPSDWSFPVQVFVFWLALVIWNREDSAAVIAATS